MLRTVTPTRYITPLREGGSLPGLVEADDLGTYVLKFRGAGQGRKALIAEVIAGELARRLGLPVPELVLALLDPDLGRTEPDQEVQDLLRASPGLNLGMDYLPGALGFDAHTLSPSPGLAARVLWFDALVHNVDRSWRNPNLLVWHRRLYLIDHGAALYVHHSWRGTADAAAAGPRPYRAAAEHVLLPWAQPAALAAADAELADRLADGALVREVVELVPDEWLAGDAGFSGPGQVRAAYLTFFTARLAAPRPWAQALEDARAPRL